MIRNAKRRAALIAVAGTAILGIGLSGCAGGGGDDSGDSEGRTLRVWAGSQTPITANFNPFAPSVLHAALGPIYEPLFFYNKTADDAPAPMLGESFEYNEDGTVITVKLKEGVKWNDGEDFTADDVVFTFDYEPNKPRRPRLGRGDRRHHRRAHLRRRRSSRTSSQILGTTWMLPEHIWSRGRRLHHVHRRGAGRHRPVRASTASTDASYTVVANEEFRDEGVPAIKKLQYIGIDANQSAAGPADRGRARLDRHVRAEPRLRHLQRRSSARSTRRRTRRCSTPARTPTSAATGPQTDVAVRQALNVAIDRGTINEKAFVGLDRRHLADLRAAAARREVGRRPGQRDQPAVAATPRPRARSSRPPATRRAPTASTRKDGAPIELEPHLGRRLDRLQRRREAHQRAGGRGRHQGQRLDRRSGRSSRTPARPASTS